MLTRHLIVIPSIDMYKVSAYGGDSGNGNGEDTMASPTQPAAICTCKQQALRLWTRKKCLRMGVRWDAEKQRGWVLVPACVYVWLGDHPLRAFVKCHPISFSSIWDD